MEFVFVVPRAELFGARDPQGFLPLAGHRDEIGTWLARGRERGFFMERRAAETRPEYKQLIPYTVVVDGAGRVLLLRRSKRGGDARLHDKLSIGVGGHVNPPDSEHADLLAACARRELDEELEIDAPVLPLPAGVINDDGNAVGAVHFGIVHVARVGSARVAVRETELLAASFVPKEEVVRLAGGSDSAMETWSAAIAAHLDLLLAEAG